MFALSGVGLMFVDSDNALRYVAASDDAIRALESAQEQLGEGPCLDSIVLDAVVRTPDLTTDPRYRSVGALVGPLGVRARCARSARRAGDHGQRLPFDRLRRAARNSRRKVGAIAADVLDGAGLPVLVDRVDGLVRPADQ